MTDVVLSVSAALISLLLAVIGVFLYRLLTQLDSNTLTTNGILARIVGIEEKMEWVQGEIASARDLRVEVKILQNEFRLHQRLSRGNGKCAEIDEEH